MTQKMTLLTKDLPSELLKTKQPPCLSLYQPTHRHSPEKQQDPIRYRNLVKELEASLRQKYPACETKQLLEPFNALGHDYEVWNNTLDGLAALSSPGLFQIFMLQRRVAELVVVADSYHVKPLRHLLQTIDRYQILGLSLDRIRLFEGNRDVLDEIEPAAGVPRTIADALGDQLTEPHQAISSYAGAGIAGSMPKRHSFGSKKDELEKDMERFFRAIDRAVLEHHSRHSRLPLILAALPEHHYFFQQMSHNPFLAADGIMVNPGAVSVDELRVMAWQTIEPQYHSQLAALAHEFTRARSKRHGSDDLEQVAGAAVAGRIATLLLQDNRQIAGRLDRATGRVEFGDFRHQQVNDVLDDLGELVEKKGGRVLVVPAEQMPTSTGVAAIYRF